MKQRGFTLLEILVAISIAAVTLGILASAMRTQGRSAVFQMGTADMQQNVRGALDLFKREVRMAGYGMSSVPEDVLAPVEVPASDDQYRVVLRGNFDNVKSRGSAAAGSVTITLDAAAAPFPTFVPGERVAIESALMGIAEVRTITAFDPGTAQITVDANLVNDYEGGSRVNQLNEFTYRLDDQNILWRDGSILADQMDVLQMQYVLEDGAMVADPSGSVDQLRSADIHMHAEQPEHSGLQPEAELDTEVRIRNLGIVAEPGVGT